MEETKERLSRLDQQRSRVEEMFQKRYERQVGDSNDSVP